MQGENSLVYGYFTLSIYMYILTAVNQLETLFCGCSFAVVVVVVVFSCINDVHAQGRPFSSSPLLFLSATLTLHLLSFSAVDVGVVDSVVMTNQKPQQHAQYYYCYL